MAKGATNGVTNGGTNGVAIYARVSTDDKGQTPDNQLLQLRSWCERMGYPVVREYVEHENGGKGAEYRKQLAAMFTGAARREFDLLLVWSLDRFSREGMAATVVHLQRRGCPISCVSSSREALYLVEEITDMAQAIRDEVIEELLQGYSAPQDLLGEEGLFKQLKKKLLERALGAELSEHLGYEKGDPAGRGSGNSRNGHSSKTVLGDDGAIELAIPRDRNGSFEPQIVAKGQTRLDGFDDRIISLYARGLSVREIQAHLQELYGVEVSPDLISRVTDAVLEEVREWQSRPLDPVYPVIFFDALRVKIRDEGLVRNKAVYVALALNSDGEKEVLGLWIEQTEGAKFCPRA